MARKFAGLLGAQLVRSGSNEVRWRGTRAVIKSCRAATTSFGVTTAMLDRLDVILVAIETEHGAFEVHEMPVGGFRAGMRESRSGGGDPKVQMVRRDDAVRHGRAVASFSAQEVANAGPP
jgi:hypothetical protein